VAGIGLEAPVSAAAAAPAAAATPRAVAAPAAPPYIVYLGRVSVGKGVDRLLDWFLSYCERPDSPKDVVLKLAGHREADLVLPTSARVEYLGYLSDADRDALIRGAVALVNPSARESLSLVALEAMAAGIPVRYYAEQTPTVFAFAGANELAGALATVLGTDWQTPAGKSKLAATQAWALDRFGWAKVLGVFKGLVDG
jgi:glycosyltransferase involved in cell wall biosynthesis